MPRLRIALAQVNPTVGDIAGNTALIRRYVERAHRAGAQLVAFGEMALTGYPIEDLAYRESLIHASKQAISALAEQLAHDGAGEPAVIVGYLDADGPLAPGAARAANGGPRNAAAILQHGAVLGTYFKHALPTYGVFDEARYFVPGNQLSIVRVAGVDIAPVICEDIWQPGGPIAACAAGGVGLVVCINGSPYEQQKDHFRQSLCTQRASEAGAPLAYVNLVGGQDELVFDGDSLIVSASGELLARSPQFVEDLLLADLELPAATSNATGPVASLRPGEAGETVRPGAAGDAVGIADAVGEAGAMTISRPSPSTPHRSHPETGSSTVTPSIAELLSDEAESWRALTVGLRDYVHKNGFRSAVLGLSGGIDSALVAALACDALGAQNVYGVSLPSEFSSQHSQDDAAELAQRTGLNLRTVPIGPMVTAFQETLKLSGLAQENLQARVRGTTLMGISNQEGHLLLATGNKSEYAVGYSTLYGDAAGGFAPIKDVLKTVVWRLAEWRNAEALRLGQVAPIPERSISKPPSAELRPGQLDTDSLPDYPLLDAILAEYIDRDQGRSQLIAGGHDPVVVDRIIAMVDRAEYKRRQSAPGTKITLKSFGRDRRLPMTNGWRED